MRAQQLVKWLILVSVLALVTACQPTQLGSAPSAAVASIAPLATFEVTAEVESAPVSASIPKTSSGVYLTAQISPMCVGTMQRDTRCVQPYMGEFVITTLNGAVVTSVMTNREGQAVVELPPGKYILGVKTENVYPLAAPVKVNVLANRYVHLFLNLDSGLRGQPPR